jgi:DNA-binding MarR family transcriptional regulator
VTAAILPSPTVDRGGAVDAIDYLYHTSDVSTTSFATLARQIARGLSRLERDEICCGDVTLQQYDTIRLVHDGGSLSTGDIASALSIDLSTASRNLAVLEKNGYVVRVRSETDARHVVNKLTRKGMRCIESLCCDERSAFDGVFARVPASRRAAVLDALAVLADALAESSDASAANCCTPAKAKPSSRERCCP